MGIKVIARFFASLAPLSGDFLGLLFLRSESRGKRGGVLLRSNLCGKDGEQALRESEVLKFPFRLSIGGMLALRIELELLDYASAG